MSARFFGVAIAGALLLAWMLYIPGATWWSIALSALAGWAIGFGLVVGTSLLIADHLDRKDGLR